MNAHDTVTSRGLGAGRSLGLSHGSVLRSVEPLHAAMGDVDSDGALLGLTRLQGETDDTWRSRVAYGLQVRLFEQEGIPIPARVTERREQWELKARVEAEGEPVCVAQVISDQAQEQEQRGQLTLV